MQLRPNTDGYHIRGQKPDRALVAGAQVDMLTCRSSFILRVTTWSSGITSCQQPGNETTGARQRRTATRRHRRKARKRWAKGRVETSSCHSTRFLRAHHTPIAIPIKAAAAGNKDPTPNSASASSATRRSDC
eukprot:3940093-Rhodomonas_salina.1